MGAENHPCGDLEVEAEFARRHNERVFFGEDLTELDEALARPFTNNDDVKYDHCGFGESFGCEDWFYSLKTNLDYGDREIDEMEERYERRLEGEEFSLAWDAGNEQAARLAFWDAFQDRAFPIRKYNKRFRVRH